MPIDICLNELKDILYFYTECTIKCGCIHNAWDNVKENH